MSIIGFFMISSGTNTDFFNKPKSIKEHMGKYYWKPATGKYAGKWFFRENTKSPDFTGPFNSFKEVKMARANFYDRIAQQRKAVVISMPIFKKNLAGEDANGLQGINA